MKPILKNSAFHRLSALSWPLLALLGSGCLESTMTLTVHPDRSGTVSIDATQTRQENRGLAFLMEAAGAGSLSIAQAAAWEGLPATMGRGVSLSSLSITEPQAGMDQVAAVYAVNDVRSLQLGLGQAAPMLKRLNIGPANWSYRFIWKDAKTPQLSVIPPRPRPRPGIVSPREALDQFGGATLGERALAPLLRGAKVRFIVQAREGLVNSSAHAHPELEANQIMMLDLSMDRLQQAQGLSALLDIKDYEGLKGLYRHHPRVACTFCKFSISTLKSKSYGYPTELKTIGDHLRAKRMDLNIHQKLQSTQLGCGHLSLVNWELNHHQPTLKFMPKIVEFLGYDPLPKPKGFMEELDRYRVLKGWSINRLALKIGIPYDSLKYWFKDNHPPTSSNMSRIESFWKEYSEVIPRP